MTLTNLYITVKETKRSPLFFLGALGILGILDFLDFLDVLGNLDVLGVLDVLDFYRDGYYLPKSLSIRSRRPMRRSSSMMARRISGLYQKKNWRWASLSRCDFAEKMGCSV